MASHVEWSTSKFRVPKFSFKDSWPSLIGDRRVPRDETFLHKIEADHLICDGPCGVEGVARLRCGSDSEDEVIIDGWIICRLLQRAYLERHKRRSILKLCRGTAIAVRTHRETKTDEADRAKKFHGALFGSTSLRGKN